MMVGLLVVVALVAQTRATTLLPSSASPTTSTIESSIPTPGVEAVKSSELGRQGDTCKENRECLETGGLTCLEDPARGHKTCQCRPDLPATNHLDKCGPQAELNETCDFNEQCITDLSICRDGRCSCLYDNTPMLRDNKLECIAVNSPSHSGFYGDPAMIGVLIGMGLMFIIICIVLRLFSQARWRENRTIFNTPNPRLMNVSLLRENKGLERRGSKGSNHPAPSRQPSLASLRPQSPAAHSQGSRASLRGSRSSTESTKSPTGASSAQVAHSGQPTQA